MHPLLLLTLVILAGCSSVRHAPLPRGELFALNPDRWQPTAQDLRP